MKQFMIAAGVLFLSSLALASPKNYLVQGQLYVDGKQISSPSMTVLAGRSGEASIRSVDERVKTEMKVFVDEIKDSNIKDEVFLRVELKHKSPSRSIESTHRLHAKLGSEAIIVLSNKDGKEELLFKVAVQVE